MYPYVVEDLLNVSSEYNVPFVDMNPVFDNSIYKGKQLYIDHVHLTPFGGEVVAKTVLPAVDSLCRDYFLKIN